MSTRKHPSRFRAIRPVTEDLEERKMLSATISGTDIDGDKWTLKLIGPGSLRVLTQNDSSGNPVPLSQPALISQIDIAGTIAGQSRLVGTVVKGPNGDGKVFFQNMTELGNRAEATATGNGLLAINMPNFWLGLTNPNGVTTTTEPSISIPDGVNTLSFGGVDVTAFFGQDPTKALNKNGQSDALNVTLGLPQSGGTRVVLDKVVTDAQAATSSSGSTTQDGVNFTVTGRLNLFQANAINGNTTFPSANFGTSGGTLITSISDTASGVSAALGDIRIGGNATNLAVTTSNQLGNFSVGGETNNVSLLTVGGIRNMYFGKGLDTTTIMTHTIENLQANRGALNSTVTVDRQIGNVVLGGDVVGTTIESGYDQQLSSALANPANPPTATAQAGGDIHIRIAGNVQDSIIAASTEPFNGNFGTAQDLRLTGGRIVGKIEGTINNANATPSSPNTAFYAKSVGIRSGPVVPPNVPEAPYPKPSQPVSLPGIPNLNSNNNSILAKTITTKSTPTGPKKKK